MRTHCLIRAIYLAILFSLPTLCLAQEARIVIPAGVVNEAYSQNIAQVLAEKYRVTLRSSSTTPTFEWRIVGPAPAGLGMDGTGTVFGTPVTAKSHLFRVEVLDRALTRPVPLRFLVSLQIASGEAPVLVPLEPARPSQTPSSSNDEQSVTIQNNTQDDVEIPSVVPRKKFTLPIKIKNDAIRQLAVVARNTASKREVTALTPPELPRGEVLTSVNLDLEEGENTIFVTDASSKKVYREFKVTVRPTDVDPAVETDLELKHSGFVSEEEKKTSVTVKVGPKVRKINVATFEKAEDGTLTKAMEKIKAPELKRDVDSYPVSVDLAKDVTRVVVTDLTPGSQVGEKSLEIKRDKALNVKASEDSKKAITVKDPAQGIEVDSPFIDAYLTVGNDIVIDNVQYELFSDGRTVDTSRKFQVPAAVEGKPREVRIPVRVLRGANIITFFNAADRSKPEHQAHLTVTCKGENCVSDFDIAKFHGSQNSRTVVGLEQAGGSSADSKTKPFLDFFFSTPLFLGRCSKPDPPKLPVDPLNLTPQERREKSDYENDKRDYDKCVAERLPRLNAWGHVRLTSTPDQIAAAGVLPSNFVNQLGTSTNTVDLVQSFDFVAGLEGRVYSANGSFLSLIPGVRQRSHFYLAAGGGAINPLSAKKELAEIYMIPPVGHPQRDTFISRYGTPPAGTEFVGLQPVDRDRFLRQWYAGLRLKTFYCDNADCTIFKNNFPAIVDFMVGQNEAVTGGHLHHLVADPNDPTRTIKKRSYVLRFDAFYPFPIRQANFIYFYGSALMKIGAGGVRIENPLFLNRADGTVLITDPRVYIPPADLQKLFQPSRDYYKLGIGVNLTELFNRNKNPR